MAALNLTLSVRLEPEAQALLHQLLQAIDRNSAVILKQGMNMAQLDDDISALSAKVAAETTVVQGVVTLLNGIPDLIANAVAQATAAGATPAQLQALTDLGTAIDAQSQSLAQAAANVPGQTPAPAPAPAPTPAPASP